MARSKFKGERPNSTKVHEIKVKGASKANKVKVSFTHKNSDDEEGRKLIA